MMSGISEFGPRVDSGETFEDRDAYHAAVLEAVARRAGQYVTSETVDPLEGHSPFAD